MNNDFPFNHFLNFGSEQPKAQEENIQSHFNNFNNLESENIEKKSDTNLLNSNLFNQDEINSISEEVITNIRSVVSAEKYKAFFENTFDVASIGPDTITFKVTNNFIKKMILNHYLSEITNIISDMLGKVYQIEIKTMDELQNSNVPLASSTQKSRVEKETSNSKDLEFDISNLLKEMDNTTQDKSQPTRSVEKMSFKIDFDKEKTPKSADEIEKTVQSAYIQHNNQSNYTKRLDKSKIFDNFIVGPSNNMAYAFSLAVAKDPGTVYPQLYIHGNSGLGKTHLLHALCNYINEQKPHLRICFTNANEFMSEMVLAIQSTTGSDNKISEFRRKYTELVDVLIIDDIHELKNKTRTQSEFFFIFNELQSKGKQLVFTSDKAPKEIVGIEDRIRTRLSSALLIDIQQPDLETRIAILKKKALEKDIYLEDDVINLIASCVKTNVRELEGNLVKLGAYSDLMNVDIDLEIAKEQLNLCEGLDDKILTIDSITRAVASYYKIALGDIKGKSRKKEVALARHIAMYMSHKILKKTLEDIGEFFDNRDHSTVIHGIKKIQTMIKDDAKISQQVFEIESRL